MINRVGDRGRDTAGMAQALSAVPGSCTHTVRMQFLHRDLLPCITQLPTPKASLGLGENGAGDGKQLSIETALLMGNDLMS